MNGFELLSRFENIPFHVIFVTAYNQFALQAFKFNALDYLVKPVTIDELRAVIEKAEKKVEADKTHFNIAAEQFRKGVITKIAITSQTGITFIDIRDISFVESSGNYSFLKLTDGKKVIITKTLKDVQDVLEQQHFMRVHRQYIINLNMVKNFHRTDSLLTMTTGDIIPVSRNHKDELIAQFNWL